MVAIKFCGLTRAEDAREAAALGAGYAGVIFAGGPRRLTPLQAAAVFSGLPRAVRRVGVFGPQADDEILATAVTAGLNVVQLHGELAPGRIERLRAAFSGEVWPVLRVSGKTLPQAELETARAADAFLLDTLGADGLGGTGRTFDWDAVAGDLEELRRGRRLVLAGGLTPENVARAIATLRPEVVDVASGVETSPGIKDHQRMRAFRDAALGADTQA